MLAESGLEVNQTAPDFRLISHSGTPISLSDYRGKKHILLYFVRTFRCYICREHVINLGLRYGELTSENAEVLAILHDNLDAAERYAQLTHTSFPILADPEYIVYAAYGLTRQPTQETRTAAVVVNQTGIITYIKTVVNPWSWQHESEKLIQHIRTINSSVYS